MMIIGLILFRLYLSVMWRCGAVERPVFPEMATGSPAAMSCPLCTRTCDKWQ